MKNPCRTMPVLWEAGPLRFPLPFAANRPLLLVALVDSGAEDNLIDSELARQLELPLEALKTPLPTVALNGETIARVTHRTC